MSIMVYLYRVIY